MSRRAPNPAAERQAQNQATLKSLLKLEPNKICADCKRNKHPRWASWNLGVFICIRCSGIHRGMGTHISRVKSVDLDSWTEEQMQSILSWGNARANKYFEAKLAQGHVPSEAKIENFIRTKYELKRWAMEGPRPDPSTLGTDADDDVPLSVVKEKQAIERKTSVKGSTSAPPRASPAAPAKAPALEADLIGGDVAPPRSNTAGPPAAAARVPPKADPAPPKATSNASLLGLDFFGEPAAPPRPASTTGVSSPAGQSRPDLKQSILSLYASAPKPQPQQQPQHQHQGSFGGFGGMPPQQQQQQQQQSFGSAGGFNDAFGSLSIGNAVPAPAPADPFASLGGGGAGSRAAPRPAANTSSAFGGLSGGSFFDQKPAQPPAPKHQSKPSDGGFGDFGGFASSPAPAPAKPAQTTSSSMGDLFDLSAPATTTSPPPQVASPPTGGNSVFNLSAPQAAPAPAPAPKPAAAPAAPFSTSSFSGADVWGASAWGSPDPAAASKPAAPAPAPVAAAAAAAAPAMSDAFGGWGSGGGSFASTSIVPGAGGSFASTSIVPGAGGGFASTSIVPGAGGGFSAAPQVSADEEFGGWASSTAPSSGANAGKSSGGVGGDEDLFSNVWQ